VDIILLVLHVVLSLGIITLVLLQKGAGASAGAAFGGGGGAGSVFGASGSANFLSKTTAIFATAFFINSLVLAYLASNREVPGDSVLDALTAPVEVPAEGVVDIPPSVEEMGEQLLAPDMTEDVPAPDTSLAPADEVPSADDMDAGDLPPPAEQ